jgi:hypothetical protein
MKKFIAFCLLLISVSVLTLPAFAVDGDHVKYLGGTAQGVRRGAIGRLNTTPETELIFEYSGNKLAIPYAAIQSFQSSEEVARHLGVVPAIVVGMFKKRQRRHFFRIEYHDSNNGAQALVFEVPKQMPRILQAVLEARAPGAYRPCRPCANGN